MAIRTKLVRSFSIFVLAVAVLIFGVTAWSNSRVSRKQLADAKRDATDLAETIQSEIYAKLQRLEIAASPIVESLSKADPKEDDIREIIFRCLENHPGVFQCGVAFEPGALKKKKLSSFFVERLGKPRKEWTIAFEPGVLKKKQLSSFFVERLGKTRKEWTIKPIPYDYTKPNRGMGKPRTHWYTRHFGESPEPAGWPEPYQGVTGHSYVEYTFPIHLPGRRHAGVGFVNFDLHEFRDVVGTLPKFPHSISAVFTRKGTIVSHPMVSCLGQNISNLSIGDIYLERFASTAESGVARKITDDKTDRIYWAVRKPIGNPDWSVAVTFLEDEILGTQEGRRGDVKLLLATLFMIGAGLMVLLRVERGGRIRLWVASLLFALLCTAATAGICAFDIASSQLPVGEEVEVLDPLDLEGAVVWLRARTDDGKRRIRSAPGIDKWITIPTGVFVQSIQFTGAYNVAVSGYVWQHVPGEVPDGFEPGVVFPEAGEVSFEPAFGLDEASPSSGGGKIYRWRFHANLRQPFNYDRYPFDREYVWLRLWPRDLSGRVILVPDFPAHSVTHPSHLPGVDEDIVIEGWKTERSYYSYRVNAYSADLGAPDSFPVEGRPELYFSVGLRRSIFESFVSDFIPLFVISLLLFAVLLISSSRARVMDLYGFSSATVLAYCASLFFVLIVSHVHLRQSLGADGIIYLEYFYFTMYLMILLVSLNSIVLASTLGEGVVHRNDGLAQKLFYWPVVTFLVLLATLWEFR